MKKEYINQYGHTWRMFTSVVKAFDDDSWLHTGRAANTPARIATHILQGTMYYIKDTSTKHCESGKSFDIDWAKAVEDDLPTQNDILACINEMKTKTEKWISELEFTAENDSFPWTGKSKLSVVIFLLRHSVYHIGELSALLNESRSGETEDHWVKAL